MKLHPIAHHGKGPTSERNWKDLISDDPAQHRAWLDAGLNLGFPLEENNCSAIDFDVKEKAREFWRKHVAEGLWNVATETYRGVHLICGGKTQTRKLEFGDIKGNGYLIWNGSVVRQKDGSLWQYRFVLGFEWKEPLCPFPEHLFPVVEKVRAITRDEVRNLDAYLAKVESLQGKDGSGGLVRAAAICRDAGLSEAETMAKLVFWNSLPVVSPPWPLTELARAVDRVFQRGKRK